MSGMTWETSKMTDHAIASPSAKNNEILVVNRGPLDVIFVH